MVHAVNMCDNNERNDQEGKEESPKFAEDDAMSKCDSSRTNNQEMEVFERKPIQAEGKKPRTPIKLPGQSDLSSKDETQVGDDFTKRDEQNIICECQPNVTGAAIPTIASINRIVSSSSRVSDENICMQSEKINHSDPESSEIPSTSKANSENKVSKKPSMIPKLARPNSSNRPVRDRGQTDLLKKPVNKKLHLQPKKLEHVSPKDKIDGKNMGTGMHSEDRPTSKISSRMFNLQERLKATTSMLRQRFKEDKNKSDSSCQIFSGCSLTENESIGSQTSEEETSPTTVEELYKAIIQLKNTATNLSSISILKKKKSYIKKLFLKITEIQKIADQLTKFENGENEVVNGKEELKKEAMIKDNQIHIKFVPKKDKNMDKNKVSEDNSERVHTEPASGPKLASEFSKPEVDTANKTQQEINMKDSDSLDGIFIPSCEPPINIQEEDESNGLDITITFPEINNLLSQQEDSHLSVRLSDISEEALKKLKRCPKDFTLRMDFVQGKVLFQTGKAPVNNFSIGPDLKFVENPVDEKKSDIISIKPSTECSFASQLIPVESITKEISSYKSLRSTDSELFSVVNLPFIYRNPSLHTTTKSCITFKNDGFLSMALLARHFGRSMPQIPSLTNIFEEKMLENMNKATALQIQERRRKNRGNQKRGIITPNTV